VNEPGNPARPRRGTLRVYLGAAPGVGKTFAMLNEGRRRHERGTDVVVGFVEFHGRALTAAQVGDLEVIPRRTIEYRGATFEEMDLDAILARRPEQALVDEYAHTNVPGSRNEKRWQDVDELLDAGIDVVSNLNIQHLESLNDVVEQITGVRQRETVPDRIVRRADQIELVDMAPEALRRRMAHGNVYPAEKVDAALGNYFRVGNLSALRELALMWVADRVDDSLHEYRDRHGITKPWETRERVVVALSGAPAGEQLVRRAARIAERTKGELIGVHVVDGTGLASGLADRAADGIAAQRRLLEDLGGEYRRVTGNDIATALVEVARSENATQIVLGASNRSRWQELVNGSVINKVVRLSGPIDVHVISERPTEPPTSDGAPDNGERRLPAIKKVLTPLPPRRQAWGWAIAAVGLPLLTLLFANTRDTFGLHSILLIYLILAMVVALVGGVLPAAAAVVVGFLLANWFFTPPFYEWTISEAENLLALLIYVVAAGMVAVLVDRVGRSRLQASRSRAEAEALAALAGAMALPGPLSEMLGQVRATFGFRSAALLWRRADGWNVEAASGVDPPSDPEGADVHRELGDGIVLALAGGSLSADDQRVLNAFAAQLAAAAESQRLHDEAGKATELAHANDLRAALLQAVSHDLRTPLASIKAAVSSLRQTDIAWPQETEAEFEATIESETDRLTALVGNLLDMSRLQASALSVDVRPTGVEEVVIGAVSSLGAVAPKVDIDVAETLPPVAADAALLERALANLIANAVDASPPSAMPRVTAGEVGAGAAHRLDICVIDSGPGIPRSDRELVFQPFQRLEDHRGHGAGVGLGLAIARGFVEAMGGELTVDDTPGGGTTMVVSLPIAGAAARTREPA
jgi:two-component system, OmpR family, sensor histidine kinase KdpD